MRVRDIKVGMIVRYESPKKLLKYIGESAKYVVRVDSISSECSTFSGTVIHMNKAARKMFQGDESMVVGGYSNYFTTNAFKKVADPLFRDVSVRG